MMTINYVTCYSRDEFCCKHHIGLPGGCYKACFNDLWLEAVAVGTVQDSAQEVEDGGQEGGEACSPAEDYVQLLKAGKADGPEEGQHEVYVSLLLLHFETPISLQVRQGCAYRHAKPI